MKKINMLFGAVLLITSFSAEAQYMQNRPAVEPMFKADVGYAPFIANSHKGDKGFIIDHTQSFANADVMGGVCISQDFFLGIGLGYNYFANPNNIAGGLHGASAYVDFDYHPLQIEFSPMFYAKAGASYLINSEGAYGSTLTPMVDLGVGCNWYFRHAVVNMERNYRSLFLTVGVAYMQQAVFLPIRLGFRF
ncbi:MAG: hypothetical protein SPJ13_02070 [Bacteroidales bacterium]|nr:hypothetical protein [Bacteroidales bacterium]